MLTAIGTVFLLSAFAPRLCRVLGSFSGWVFALLPLGLTLFFFNSLSSVYAGEFPVQSFTWVRGLDIQLAFRLDGLSLLFALLICGIGTLITLYASGYLKGNAQIGRFYLFFFMFMASMLGVVLSDNLILLFIFWELTSLSSYFLIGFYHEDENSRKSALQALLVTGIGGLVMLAGFLMMGQMGGNMSLSALIAGREGFQSHPLFEAALILILCGAFTKSAQFPFHFWLPNAMAAPAPVSAYLHSSTMVKAGVYLIARCHPIFSPSSLWLDSLTWFGAATVLTGAWLALQQSDLKKYLAYMTVSALGVMVMLLGSGTAFGSQAAMLFLLAHALYKGCLFMVAGTVDHATHCRNPEKLGGLMQKMPWTAAAAFLAALSMAGFFPFLGFIGKEWMLETVLHSESRMLLMLAVLAGAIYAAIAIWAGVKPFVGKLSTAAEHAHEAPPSMLLGAGILACLGLVFGIFPSLCRPLLSTAASAVMAETSYPMKLVLWHGFNSVFFLSLVAIGFGGVIYFKRGLVQKAIGQIDFLKIWGPEKGYFQLLEGLLSFSAFLTKLLQGGRLRIYFRIMVVATAALTGTTLFLKNGFVSSALRPVHGLDALCVGIIFVATFAAIFARTRLIAIMAMGVIGLVISLIFVRFGAPDLAMTQFAVETLTVILLAFVLYRMPASSMKSPQRSKWIDAVISLAIGALMAALAFFGAVATPGLPEVAKYYAEHSLLLAQGSNIVNVIIVDFRALDTLGEITVVAVAGIGVFSLLKLILASKNEEAKS